MKLRCVTLTGADDRTNPEDLATISVKYSFVEWAILFSQSKAGVPRYPSLDWVLHFVECADRNSMQLSAHLCGKWVDDAMSGNLTFLKNYDFNFNRIQLNLSRDRLQQAIGSSVWHCDFKGKQIIFGGPYQKTNLSFPIEKYAQFNVSPLFDTSGGRGLEPSIWPKPFEFDGSTLLCGYAGGLGPANIREHLDKLAEVVGDAEIWVDMESSIRTNDEFDLNKCEQVLEIVNGWLKNG